MKSLRLQGLGLSLAAALGLAGAAVARAEIVVTLHEAAVVHGPRVVLRDVASIGTARRQLSERIESIDLGPAPIAHERVVLRQDVLAAHVARQLQSQGGLPIRWTGAASVTLQRGMQALPTEQLQAAADSALRAWLASQPVTRYEIEPLATPPASQVPSGALQLSVRPLPAGQAPAGHITLWVEVRVDDRLVRQLPVVMKVRSYASRWLARVDLPARSPVDAGSFEQREEVLALPYRPTLLDLPPASARLVRPIRAGQALEAADVGGLVDVMRGDPVTVSIYRGLVSVQARAEALRDGRSGQSIPVRIAGATAAVMAQVTGPGRVQVNE